MTRKLLFVTGTRADYGKLEPLAQVAADGGFDVTFFVTGMHMLEKFGLTRLEVARNRSFAVVEFVNQRDGDPQDIILAKTTLGFSDYLQELRPDLVLIHGDRVEALACAQVCAINYVRCAHIEGGEISGTIDEVFRHCNTKLSHVHLVSSQEAGNRVKRLGEIADAIHVIGSPELDAHRRPSGVSLDEVLSRYEIRSKNYGICILHPVTSEKGKMGLQAKAVFDALAASRHYFVVILPNNDPGSDEILVEIRNLSKERFRVLPSMRFSYFSELLRNAHVIVGNSSTGVREAPFLGIPSLDVGTRQSKRAKGPSIFHAKAGDMAAVLEFIDKNWGRRFEKNANFGSGMASQNFLELLRSEKLWSVPLQKYFAENA